MAANQSYDLAAVGAGVIGLACALAAARRGQRVIVLDRDAQASGASVGIGLSQAAFAALEPAERAKRPRIW